MENLSGRETNDSDLDRLAIILGMYHDIGKACCGFQERILGTGPGSGHIRELSGAFGPELADALRLESLGAWFESPEDLVSALFAAWSHHGAPFFISPSGTTDEAHKALWKARGAYDPLAEVARVAGCAREAFPAAYAALPALPFPPRLQHYLAGLLMLADWIGSDERFFPIERPEHFHSFEAARDALRRLGLDIEAAREGLGGVPPAFESIFPYPPRGLQCVIAEAADERLTLAEAETGAGKTEAALIYFLHLFATGRVDGLYLALPTRVAAREIYGRVFGFAQDAFPDPAARPPALLAVAGYARVDGTDARHLLEGPDGDEDGGASLRDRAWAAERSKRFLAAPLAIGTIDQALLSTLLVRHAHLRAGCLTRSLLVVDEVHASDPYMRSLLKDLLQRHTAAGGHALLLSATLGSSGRAELLGAPSLALNEALAQPYPLLSAASGRSWPVVADEARRKRVRIEARRAMSAPETVLPEIVRSLRQGARVLVVLNTVARAVAFQRALEAVPDLPPEALFHCGGVVCPHHGRFLAEDRERMDAAVTAALGKESPDGARVLVGTQTLEQSLDIDADLLVTDLCPADVFLQRLGRLWRHPGRTRPLGMNGEASCLLIVPEEPIERLLDGQGEPLPAAKRAGLGSVYPDLRILQLTLDTVTQQPGVETPRDNRLLVEMATHPERLGALRGTRWEKHAQLIQGRIAAQRGDGRAASNLPLFGQAFAEGLAFPEGALAKGVRTRLGLDSYHIPLDRPLATPFGGSATEAVLPGHLLRGVTDLVGEVLATDDDRAVVAIGGKRLHYTRFGWETE